MRGIPTGTAIPRRRAAASGAERTGKKIIGPETGELLQRRQVLNEQVIAQKAAYVQAADPRQCPIQMHRRNRQRVGNIRLPERHFAAPFVSQPQATQAEEQLAQHVGRALQGGPLAQVQQPLAKRGLLDGPGELERSRQSRETVCQAGELLPGESPDLDGRKCGDGMLREVAVARTSPAKLTGENVSQNLAAPVWQYDITTSEARQQHVIELGRFVLRTACRDAARWPEPAIVVNAVSANRGSLWDMNDARDWLGHVPQDDVWARLGMAPPAPR